MRKKNDQTKARARRRARSGGSANDFRVLLTLLGEAVPLMNHQPNPIHDEAYPHCPACKLIVESKRLIEKYSPNDGTKPLRAGRKE